MRYRDWATLVWVNRSFNWYTANCLQMKRVWILADSTGNAKLPMSLLCPGVALLVIPRSTIRQRVNVARKLLAMQPDARPVPVIIFLGFMDHLDMKSMLTP